VTLTRPGFDLAPLERLDVARDGSLPAGVDVPDRDGTTVLSLPQNVNPGWSAALAGQDLPAQRVAGWQQGWVLPAGAGGTAALRFGPQHLFDLLLVIGAVLVLLVALAATPLRLRRRPRPDRPPLEPAAPGVVDGLLVAVAAGFLTGWVGLAAVVGAWLAARRFPSFRGWAYVAGVSLLVATAALTWDPLKKQSWALDWAQVWAAVSVAAVSVALLAAGTRGRRASRAARAASSSGRS
jgi:arabinofuranan 3-O-arabinosyltransferase